MARGETTERAALAERKARTRGGLLALRAEVVAIEDPDRQGQTIHVLSASSEGPRHKRRETLDQLLARKAITHAQWQAGKYIEALAETAAPQGAPSIDLSRLRVDNSHRPDRIHRHHAEARRARTILTECSAHWGVLKSKIVSMVALNGMSLTATTERLYGRDSDDAVKHVGHTLRDALTEAAHLIAWLEKR